MTSLLHFQWWYTPVEYKKPEYSSPGVREPWKNSWFDGIRNETAPSDKEKKDNDYPVVSSTKEIWLFQGLRSPICFVKDFAVSSLLPNSVFLFIRAKYTISRLDLSGECKCFSPPSNNFWHVSKETVYLSIDSELTGGADHSCCLISHLWIILF